MITFLNGNKFDKNSKQALNGNAFEMYYLELYKKMSLSDIYFEETLHDDTGSFSLQFSLRSKSGSFIQSQNVLLGYFADVIRIHQSNLGLETLSYCSEVYVLEAS